MKIADFVVLITCWILALGLFTYAVYIPYYFQQYQMIIVAMGLLMIVLGVFVTWKAM
jgi:hypothetical protein